MLNQVLMIRSTVYMLSIVIGLLQMIKTEEAFECKL